MATQEQVKKIINEVDNGKRLIEEKQEERETEKREAEFLSQKYDELKAKGVLNESK